MTHTKPNLQRPPRGPAPRLVRIGLRQLLVAVRGGHVSLKWIG